MNFLDKLSLVCGRYTARKPETFEEFSGAGLTPRFNISPGQTDASAPIHAIRMGVAGERELTAMQWWLLPFWSKTRIIKYTTFNAAVEGIETKASFREPFRKRRCLVPADGFYEWWRENEGSPKRPHFIRRRDDGSFCFAGLWDRWESKNTADVIDSCTIVTTPANELLGRIHHRCPAILPREHHDEWLDPSLHDVERLKRILRPFDPKAFQMHEVSRYVSNARHQDPRCIEPLVA